jgi:hypothetical protein
MNPEPDWLPGRNAQDLWLPAARLWQLRLQINHEATGCCRSELLVAKGGRRKANEDEAKDYPGQTFAFHGLP